MTTCCEKCLPHSKLGDCYDIRCTCHTTPATEDWRETLMDDFCVMFSRAEREVEPIDWVERMEDFIETLLTTQKAAEREAGETVLRPLLDKYVRLVESGDAGFWNPEEEDEVKNARKWLAL